MRAEAPTAKVATYCADWPTSAVDRPGLARVNPETLGNATSPEFAFRYIDISSVTAGTIDWRSVKHLRFADAPSRARRIVRGGDTMLCTVRPLLMSNTFLESLDQLSTVCSTGFAVIRSDGGLQPNFLKHLPFAEQVTRQLVAWQCGTNYPAVNERDVRCLVVPVPPPEEQSAIACILDVVDTALERAREAVRRARELRKSLVVDLLRRGIGADGKVRQFEVQQGEFVVSNPIGKLPAVWRISVVGAEFELQNGFTLNANRRARFKRRKYLRVANVQRDWLNLSDVQELEADDSEFTPRMLQVDDLLVIEGHADRMQIGRCARVTPEASGMTFQNHLFRLRTKGAVLPAFATLWLNSAYAQRFWNARCATSSGLNTINQRTLKKLMVPVPPTSEQQAITELAEQQRRHVDALAGRQAQLETLKKSLMHDLLTGRIRVGDVSKVAA